MVKHMNGKPTVLRLALVAALLLVAVGAQAGTDATVITSSVNTAFADIAAACIAIGTFFTVYKLVKRIR
jgi:hypothetical protein